MRYPIREYQSDQSSFFCYSILLTARYLTGKCLAGSHNISVTKEKCRSSCAGGACPAQGASCATPGRRLRVGVGGMDLFPRKKVFLCYKTSPTSKRAGVRAALLRPRTRRPQLVPPCTLRHEQLPVNRRRIRRPTSRSKLIQKGPSRPPAPEGANGGSSRGYFRNTPLTCTSI